MKFGKLFENPALKTRITSSNVKIQEMAIGYFLAPMLAEGGEWIEPEVRAKLEQEQADREAEAARIADLKALCQKKGLNFEEEEKKYQEKQAKRKNSLIGKLLG